MPERSTVMVIDDQAERRKAMAQALTAHGYAVVEVDRGGRPLDVLRNGRIQAAIVECDASAAGDLKVIRDIVREQPGLPVLAVTAHGTFEAGVQAMKAGARDVFARPLAVPRLLAELGRFVHEAETSGRVPAPSRPGRCSSCSTRSSAWRRGRRGSW
jgi:DNA-binding NtrC family response regulator